ncbi:hypothetical protein EV192_112345 [Actinocrispum wychmicini]|uniref:Uncharacterized protein n=1 Tax=Actinocrispum wychmicini TaxID=1213861 RepID=A0A4R2J2R1_9PSEU|nr:hypothetical protein EV192_112345 [Actinocrispum wychmicini]
MLSVRTSWTHGPAAHRAQQVIFGRLNEVGTGRVHPIGRQWIRRVTPLWVRSTRRHPGSQGKEGTSHVETHIRPRCDSRVMAGSRPADRLRRATAGRNIKPDNDNVVVHPGVLVVRGPAIDISPCRHTEFEHGRRRTAGSANSAATAARDHARRQTGAVDTSPDRVHRRPVPQCGRRVRQPPGGRPWRPRRRDRTVQRRHLQLQPTPLRHVLRTRRSGALAVTPPRRSDPVWTVNVHLPVSAPPVKGGQAARQPPHVLVPALTHRQFPRGQQAAVLGVEPVKSGGERRVQL